MAMTTADKYRWLIDNGYDVSSAAQGGTLNPEAFAQKIEKFYDINSQRQLAQQQGQNTSRSFDSGGVSGSSSNSGGGSLQQRIGVNPFNVNSRDPQERAAAVSWAAKRKQEVIDGKPDRPLFENLRAQDGSILPQYRLSGKVGLDTQGLDAMRTRALSQGPSAWATLASDKQKTDELGQLQDAAAQSAGQRASAMDMLAMRGGLQGGSSERLAMDAMRNQNALAQNIRRAGASDRQNIGLQDEQQKLGLLQALPGQELAKSQFEGDLQKFDINNALNDVLQKRGFDLAAYKEGMAGFGAERTANASGGGGGCFITTAVCEYLGLPDDNPLLNAFRKLRDEHMGGKEDPRVKVYYELAPKILPKLNDAELYYILQNHLLPAFNQIKIGSPEVAVQMYEHMVTVLKEKHLEEEK